MNAEAIILVGFMGAGKTTVGKLLAQRLGYRFIDLDDLVESREGKTVKEIFRNSGEARFRELERESLRECIGARRVVLALGGGAFVDETNRAIADEIGVTVWLDCPFEVCLARVAGDEGRPLLTAEQEVRSLYNRRQTFYAYANHVVQAGDKPPDQVAREIVEAITTSSVR